MDKGIRIVSKPGKIMSRDVKVFSGDAEINGICEISISITPDSFIIADMKVLVSELDINADATIKKVCGETIEGNDKLSRIKRMIESIVYNEEEDIEGYDFKKYATIIIKQCLREIEKE